MTETNVPAIQIPTADLTPAEKLFIESVKPAKELIALLLEARLIQNNLSSEASNKRIGQMVQFFYRNWSELSTAIPAFIRGANTLIASGDNASKRVCAMLGMRTDCPRHTDIGQAMTGQRPSNGYLVADVTLPK